MDDPNSFANRYHRFAFSEKFISVYERFHRWSTLFLIAGAVLLFFWFILFISIFTEFSYGRIFGGIVCFVFSLGFLLLGAICVMIGWNSRKWYATQQQNSPYILTQDITVTHGRETSGLSFGGVSRGSNPIGGSPARPPPPFPADDAESGWKGANLQTSGDQMLESPDSGTKSFYPSLPDADPIEDLDEQNNPYAPTTIPMDKPDPLLPAGPRSSPTKGSVIPGAGHVRSKESHQTEPLIRGPK